MKVEIIESQMTFGPYVDKKVFQFEKSKLYATIGKGIKTVEFVLAQNKDSLNFIEAKSSSPRPDKEDSVDFDCFINEITEKFLHSFNLYYAAVLGRHNDSNDLSTYFTKMDNSNIKIKFLLVIKGHQIDWLSPLNIALGKKMIVHNKLWKCECAVLNDDLAKKHGLIKSEA